MKTPEAKSLPGGNPERTKDQLTEARQAAIKNLLMAYDGIMAEAEQHKAEARGLSLLEQAEGVLNKAERVKAARTAEEVEAILVERGVDFRTTAKTQAAKLKERRGLNLEFVPSAPEISPEQLAAINEFFGSGNLEPLVLPTPEQFNTKYAEAMYPAAESADDEARGTTNHHPSWWKQAAEANYQITPDETWGAVYVRSMQAELLKLQTTSHGANPVILQESIQKPNYIDGKQSYGTIEGREFDKDPLIPILQKCFGIGAKRFGHSHDELTITFANDAEKQSFLAERQQEYTAKGWGDYTFTRQTLESPLTLVQRQIKRVFKDKSLPALKFEVRLAPAISFNLQTVLDHPENSKINTWEWSADTILDKNSEDSGFRLNVGNSDVGGAGNVDSDHRGSHSVNRGFRLAVVLVK